jgi:hypothetical protein
MAGSRFCFFPPLLRHLIDEVALLAGGVDCYSLERVERFVLCR